MLKACRLSLTLLAVIGFIPVAPTLANKANYQEFTVETRDYSHAFTTDAQIIDYKLQDYAGKSLQQGSIKRNSQTNQVQKLGLKFPGDGVFDLFLTLRDDVENRSQYQHRFLVDTADKSQGNVYGADPANPWGKSQRYQDNVANARLLISSRTLGGGYRWEKFELPPPLLTYGSHDSKTGAVYGLAVSKATSINVQVWKKFPSYLGAEKFCAGNFAGPILAGLRNHTDPKAVSCLEAELGINSLPQYYAWLTAKCEHWLPFIKASCVTEHHRKPETRYFGIFKNKLQHVRVGLYRQGSEFTNLWQEQDQKFRHSLALGAGSSITAKVSVYGAASILGNQYSYDGWSSLVSNTIALKPAQVKATTTCNNQACRSLNVEYFNQAVNSKGNWESWAGWPSKAGGQSCGAASAVMAIGHRELLSKSFSLKSYVFKDNGIKLQSKRCSRGGAFAVTAANKSCNQSSLGTIQTFLKQFGVGTRKHTVSEGNKERIFKEVIKPTIDKGKTLILSYSKPVGHILLITGYTYGGQVIVNDPYRDIQNNYIKGKYDYSGKGAIYSLKPNSKYVVNYLLETI